MTKGVPDDNGSKHDGSAADRRERFALRTALAQQWVPKRTDLQRHDISVPGHKFIQVRVDIAPGAPFVKHMHPGEEIIDVFEGLLEYQIDDKPAVMRKAGDVLFIPDGTVHAARSVGGVTGTELATYIVEKAKPLVVLVN